MSFTINVQNEHEFTINSIQLEQAAKAVLASHEVEPNIALSVVITTDEAVQTLNRTHRGVDKPTDVLSFSSDPLPEGIEDEEPYLGDLIIAYPYTLAQSDREGYSMSDSLILMVIHGTLHLLGYDHDTPENRAEMWEVQAEILEELGVNSSIVPAYEDD